MKALQAEMTALENELQTLQEANRDGEHLAKGIISQATLAFATSIKQRHIYARLSSALFLRPSCPPLAISRSTEDEQPNFTGTTDQSQSVADHEVALEEFINLATVPDEIIKRLVHYYANIVAPQYPIVRQDYLKAILASLENESSKDNVAVLVYGTQASASLSNFDYFILLMVLATAVIAVANTNPEHARRTSESFYRTALKHLQKSERVDDLEGIQACLLVAFYATQCPEMADMWACLTCASTLMLDLGLLRPYIDELSDDASADRRRLFWSLYSMERSVCCRLRLPFHFSETSIQLKVGVLVFYHSSYADNISIRMSNR